MSAEQVMETVSNQALIFLALTFSLHPLVYYYPNKLWGALHTYYRYNILQGEVYSTTCSRARTNQMF
jgi:hypothetical protein